MKVDWYMESFEGGEGALFATINSDIKATIMHSPQDYSIFFASVVDLSADEGIDKSDPSLIELMNWVEEELKFRASHD